MDTIRLSVSKKLKHYRKIKELTQEDFAEENHISVKTIAQWEQGKAEVPLYIILKLRKELNQSIDQIYGLEDCYSEMTDEEFKKVLISEFINDKIAVLNYMDKDATINYKRVMEFSIIVFFNSMKSFEISQLNNKIKMNIDENDMPIIRFLITKNLIDYEIFKDYDEETGEFYYNQNYYIDKKLALLILHNYINQTNLDIKNLSKDMKDYDKVVKYLTTTIEDVNKKISEITKRCK